VRGREVVKEGCKGAYNEGRDDALTPYRREMTT
jgi:hypothetical protein